MRRKLGATCTDMPPIVFRAVLAVQAAGMINRSALAPYHLADRDPPGGIKFRFRTTAGKRSKRFAAASPPYAPDQLNGARVVGPWGLS